MRMCLESSSGPIHTFIQGETEAQGGLEARDSRIQGRIPD